MKMTSRKHVKSLAAMLALVMAFSLTACGNSEGTVKPSGETSKTGNTSASTAEGTSGDSAQTATEKDPFGAYEDTVTLSLSRVTTANPKLPDGDSYEDNAYFDWVLERLNVQCTDAFEASGDDYSRQVSLAIASGELPDVMCIYDTSTLDELVENDLIADLTDVYDDYATDYIKGLYDSYGDRAFVSCTYDGKIMAMPSVTPDTSRMIWIRQDWLDQLGLKIDEDGNSVITKEELETVAAQFMEKNPSGADSPVGLALTPSFGWGTDICPAVLCEALGAYTGRWLRDDSGTVYEGCTAPEMKDALAYMKDLFERGILDPQFGTRTWDDVLALLVNGQTGIAFASWAFPDWGLNNVKAMDPNAEFTAFVLDNGTGKANWSYSNVVGRYIVVSKTCEHPEAAIKIMNLFYDETRNTNIAETAPAVNEYLNVLQVDGGVRPLNMEILDANNFINQQYAPVVSCLNGEVSIEELSGTSRTCAENVTRYLDDPENATVADWAFYHSRMKGIALMDKLQKQGSFNEVSPFFPSNTETMNSNLADMEKLRDETFIKIVVGELPVDEFDSFVTNWNERGGTQIAAELSK